MNGNSLRDLAKTAHLSRNDRRLIWENFFLSLFTERQDASFIHLRVCAKAVTKTICMSRDDYFGDHADDERAHISRLLFQTKERIARQLQIDDINSFECYCFVDDVMVFKF